MKSPARLFLFLTLVGVGCLGGGDHKVNWGGGDGGLPTGDQYVPVPPTTLTISVTSPARGAMLTGDANVMVEGSVGGDLSELESLKLDGQAIIVGTDGSFSAPLSAHWGVNAFLLEARAKAGATVRHAQAFHYGSTFRRLSEPGAEDGVLIRMRDRIFDDHDRSDLDDFSSIGELVMNNIDLDPIVPQTLIEGGMFMMSYSARKVGKVETGKMTVSMEPIPGGMRLSGSGTYFEVPLRLSAGPMSVTGVGRVDDFSFSVDAMISKRCTGSLSVIVARVDVQFGRISIDMGVGLSQEMMSSMINMLSTFFRGQVRSNMQQHIAGMMPDFFALFIEAIAMPQELHLTQGKLLQQASLCNVSFDQEGATIGLQTALSTEQKVADGKLGWLLQDVAPPTFEVQHSVAVSTEADLLNQLLYAAWYGGLLELQDVSSALLTGVKPDALPIAAKGFRLSSVLELPPMLMPASNGDELLMGLGDARLIFDLDRPDGSRASITAYLSVVQPAKLGYSPTQELLLTPSRPPELAHAQVLETLNLGPVEQAAAASFVERVSSAVVEHLTAGTVRAFRLPYIDTGLIVPDLPVAPKVVMQGVAVDYTTHRVRVSGEMGIGL